MGCEEHAELGGVLHGAVEGGGVGGGVAVIGEHEDAGFAHGIDGGEFLAFAIFCDAAGGVDGDAGVFASGVEEGGDGGAGVERGGCIWHHDEAGDSAVDGGFGAGGDVFLVFLAGFAEVDVCVEEGGADDLVVALDDLSVWGRGDVF